MLINKSNFDQYNILILSISLLYSLLIASGLYGFGNDYYAAYYKSNLDWGGTFDRLGFLVSTLTLFEVNLGVGIVSFILAFSVGLLIKDFHKSKNICSITTFILLYFLIIHSWPIIMSTSNAMRQGLAMSFIFFALYTSHKNLVWVIIFTAFAIFLHKSGLFFGLIMAVSIFTYNLFRNEQYSSQIMMHFSLGLMFSIIAYFLIHLYTGNVQESKIINGDFRGAFILIGVAYVALSFIYKELTSNIAHLNLFYFSLISPAVLMNGLNWEYERLGMMMLIPYIFYFAYIFDRSSSRIVIFLAFIILVSLTFYQGMYSSLK